MKIVKWRLDTGNIVGQESREKKLKLGLEYVEKLKREQNVVEVEMRQNEIVIKIEE